MEIGGSLLASYLVCKRQAWLSYHGIQGDCDNDYLRQGNYIHQEAYQRQQLTSSINEKHMDTVQHKDGKLIIGEVKKSSHCIESARIQLGYYLLQFEEDGIEAEGLLQFPEEKKTETIILTAELRGEVMNILHEVECLSKEELPPKAEWKRVCEHCSYCESCWA